MKRKRATTSIKYEVEKDSILINKTTNIATLLRVFLWCYWRGCWCGDYDMSFYRNKVIGVKDIYTLFCRANRNVSSTVCIKHRYIYPNTHHLGPLPDNKHIMQCTTNNKIHERNCSVKWRCNILFIKSSCCRDNITLSSIYQPTDIMELFGQDFHIGWGFRLNWTAVVLIFECLIADDCCRIKAVHVCAALHLNIIYSFYFKK